MLGDEAARNMLGCLDTHVGNYDRAIKHFMIATGCGNSFALKKIQKMYRYGHATKGEYTSALRSYQEYLSEIKSVQRDRAAKAIKANGIQYCLSKGWVYKHKWNFY